MIQLYHVLSDTNIGGAGTLLLNYLANADRDSFAITVVLPRGSAHEAAHRGPWDSSLRDRAWP